jgi:hypothetical protein
MFIDKKLQAIIVRTHPNIKSGRIMMDVKDRDWLFSTIKNLESQIQQMEEKNK